MKLSSYFQPHYSTDPFRKDGHTNWNYSACFTTQKGLPNYNILKEQLEPMGIHPYIYSINFKNPDFTNNAYANKPIYEYWDVDPLPNWKGDKQSYNYFLCWFDLIKRAKANRFDSILIFEDDAILQPNFQEVFEAALDEIQQFPTYKALYLGANNHKSTIYRVSDHLCRCEKPLNLQGVLIHSRMFDDILSLKEEPWLNENPYIDVTLAHYYKCRGDLYCTYPGIVYQKNMKNHEEFSGQMIDLR